MSLDSLDHSFVKLAQPINLLQKSRTLSMLRSTEIFFKFIIKVASTTEVICDYFKYNFTNQTQLYNRYENLQIGLYV